MNKQEFQQNIKDMKPTNYINSITIYDAYSEGFEEAKQNVLPVSNFLAEPEKPVVPQFVADWIKYCKSTKLTFLGAFHPVSEHGIRFADTLTDEIWKAIDWARRNQETFARAWLDGYEIEKEKLYTVEIPNPNINKTCATVLKRNEDNTIQLCILGLPDLSKSKFQLTESEIKKDFSWAWQFAKEV